MEVSAWPNLMKYDETLDIEEFCDFSRFWDSLGNLARLENKHSFHNYITSIEIKKRNPCPLVWMRAPARIVFLESLQLHLSCSQLQPPGRMDTANLSTRSWPYSWWIRDDSDHFISRSTHSKAQNHWMRYDMIGYDRIWWNYKLHDTCFKQSAQLSGSRCMKNASGSSCLSWHAWSGTLHRIKRSCPQEQRITPHEWSLAASCKKNTNVSKHFYQHKVITSLVDTSTPCAWDQRSQSHQWKPFAQRFHKLPESFSHNMSNF